MTSSAELAVSKPRAYLSLMRVDHWFKNAFMLLGVVLAFFYRPGLVGPESLGTLFLAVFWTCLVASSNYVLNEFLDASSDRQHPVKCERPAARGDVEGWAALLLWGALGLIGVGGAFLVNGPFGAAALLLWVMGCLYNLPPIRTKELPYIDVLSESLNNPIRLLLGWFALIPDRMPPLSLALAYWMVGAFFMAAKRFAELRSIGNRERAARYRRSFRYYNDARLLASMAAYLVAGALFGGIFIVRYKLELILCVPLVAGFFAFYMALSMREDSPVQRPEKLYRERRFFAYALLTSAVFVLLMYVELPYLYTLFQVEAAGIQPLWSLGG